MDDSAPSLSEHIGRVSDASHGIDSLFVPGCKSDRRGARSFIEVCRRSVSPDCRFPVDSFSGNRDVTQAVGVEGKGDDIIYRYSIATSLAELGGREKVQRGLEQQLRSAACKTKDAQTLLRAGYTVQARYSFKGSPEEILISLPPRSCEY